MNKTGLILIDGRQVKLAYGTSVRQKKKHLLPLNNKLIPRAF
jgi:hypothetical protein